LKVSTKSQSSLSIKINEESLARYCPGGYHPVQIGDSFKDGAYKVVNKLGYGQYSTVWLVQDTRSVHLHEHRFPALLHTP
jgi:serine/threonine-protein kinase SRPK3